MTAAEFFRKRTLIPHLLLDFLDVIEIIGEGCVDVPESDSRNVRNDLVGGHALMLMPRDDIEHTDAVAGNAGFSAADAGRPGDPILGGRGHDSSINRATRLSNPWKALGKYRRPDFFVLRKTVKTDPRGYHAYHRL